MTRCLQETPSICGHGIVQRRWDASLLKIKVSSAWCAYSWHVCGNRLQFWCREKESRKSEIPAATWANTS